MELDGNSWSSVSTGSWHTICVVVTHNAKYATVASPMAVWCISSENQSQLLPGIAMHRTRFQTLPMNFANFYVWQVHCNNSTKPWLKHAIRRSLNGKNEDNDGNTQNMMTGGRFPCRMVISQSFKANTPTTKPHKTILRNHSHYYRHISATAPIKHLLWLTLRRRLSSHEPKSCFHHPLPVPSPF